MVNDGLSTFEIAVIDRLGEIRDAILTLALRTRNPYTELGEQEDEQGLREVFRQCLLASLRDKITLEPE